MTCRHANFKTTTQVTRVHEDGDPSVVVAVQADVSIACADCGLRFWFPGLDTGVDWMRPVTSTDGFTLRVPIVPANTQPRHHASLTGVRVRTPDSLKGVSRG